MTLDTEVGLRHIVLGGDPADLQRGTAAPLPLFVPCLLWPHGWMDQDATWYGGGFGLGDIALGELPLERRTEPHFSAHVLARL